MTEFVYHCTDPSITHPRSKSYRFALRNHCGLDPGTITAGSRLANGVSSLTLLEYYPNSMSTYVTSHWPQAVGQCLHADLCFSGFLVLWVFSLTILTCFPRNPISVNRFWNFSEVIPKCNGSFNWEVISRNYYFPDWIVIILLSKTILHIATMKQQGSIKTVEKAVFIEKILFSLFFYF